MLLLILRAPSDIFKGQHVELNTGKDIKPSNRFFLKKWDGIPKPNFTS